MKQIRLSLVITALSLFLAAFAFAQEDSIKPFGGIEWEDGLLDVLAKLNKFDGIEKVNIMKAGEEGVDIKGIIDSKKIAPKLTDVIRQWNEIYLNPNDHRVKSAPNIMTYLDLKGREKKFIAGGLEIEAYPILIKNVPFKIKIGFTNAVGLAIHSPDKILTESKGIYTFPLIVKDVYLYSSSPTLADNYKEINNVLKSKYKKFDTFTNDAGKEMDLEDFNIDRRGDGAVKYKGIRLDVNAGESEYTILYTGGEFEKKLAEIYRKHLSTLESQKTKGKKDSASGL